MLYIAIFFILLLIYIILFVVRIKAAINYTRNKREEWLKFIFYTDKCIIRYEYEVPLQKKEGEKTRFKLVKGQSREMRGGSAKTGKLSPFDIYKKFNSVRMYLKDNESLLEDIRKYLNRKKIHVELKIDLKQGTGDAAQTGLICGLLWSAAGILTTYISRYLKIYKKEINIKPYFNEAIFEVDASCIFHVRLVHIIVVLIKIYYMKFLIKLKAKKR